MPGAAPAKACDIFVVSLCSSCSEPILETDPVIASFFCVPYATTTTSSKFLLLAPRDVLITVALPIVLLTVSKFDFTGINVFHIGESPFRIDFLTKVPGLKYEDADAHKEFFVLEERKIPVLHLNDLLINKMLSGRPKDIADVDELKKIQRLKPKK